MNKNDLEEAFCLIDKSFEQSDVLFGEPASQNLIKKAESLLEVKFPFTYNLFLKKVGFGGPGSLLISGVRAKSEDEIATTGVVWTNLQKRSLFQQPLNLIEIENIGDGSTYCLDTSQMNQEGECPVVVWPLGGYKETPVLEIVAEDFGKFFLDMVKRQIEYKKQTS